MPSEADSDEARRTSILQTLRETDSAGEITPDVSPVPLIELTFRILNALTEGTQLRSLNVRLWNGLHWPDEITKPATLVLNRPSALREMLEGGSEVAVAQAYINEAFDIEGDMIAAFELADLLATRTRGWTQTLSIAALLRRLPAFHPKNDPQAEHVARLKGAKNTLSRDRRAIRFHYDVSNAFYALWLDPRMVYSCAYFKNAGTSLEKAQERKLDYICHKLNLRPGERMLDVGCGWGGLLLHAAEYYGVKADGITLSQNQLEWVERLIQEKGLQDRVRVRLIDYRELKDEGLYDKAVSVGMVEHVGRQNFGTYFQQIWSLVKPGGLFLNHGIGLGPVVRPNEGESFIDQYVFPDSDLVSIGHMVEAAEKSAWEIRDVESWREHYALTLRHWVHRLKIRHEEAIREVDEATYRIWRLYMAGSAHGFDRGYLSIYQTLLAKLTADRVARIPMTRDGWVITT